MAEFWEPSAIDAEMESVYEVPVETLYEPYMELLHSQLKEISMDSASEGKEYKLRLQRSRIETQIELLEALSLEMSWGKHFMKNLRPSVVDSKELVINQPTPKYLCLSNGFKILCLDLNLSYSPDSDSDSAPPPLPLVKFSLPDDLVTVSAGLFSMNSQGYMIGGRDMQVPAEAETRYINLCLSYIADIKSASLVTYPLQMSVDGPSLCRSDWRMFKDLNTPKLWPIVEMIGGKLHVIDSNPPWLPIYSSDIIFSHEFLHPERGWTSLETIKDKDYITSHSVVGSHMYAIGKHHKMKFTADTMKWEATKKSRDESWKHPFGVKHVWDILELGMARCVREYKLVGFEAPTLFVLIGVAWDSGSPDGELHDGTVAVAYLVNKEGRVVCFQHLPRFFEGARVGARAPYSMSQGTMFRVSIDKPGPICAVVEGEATLGPDYIRYLYINTFNVELIPAAFEEVGKFLLGAREDRLPKEIEFVRLHVIDRYIFTNEAPGVDPIYFPTMQACFVTVKREDL